MIEFDADAIARLRSDAVGLAILVEFDFVDAPLRVWSGIGKMTTADGRTWRGIYGHGVVSGVRTETGLAAEKVEFQLARLAEQGGVAIDAAAFSAAVAEDLQALDGQFAGRRVSIYVQVRTEQGENIGPPIVRWAGKMTRPSASWAGASAANVRMQADTIWAATRGPRNAVLADRDQQARYAGDRACEFIETLSTRNVKWW